MSSSTSITVKIPSAATLSEFCASHRIQSSSAIIAVGYSLVLHRFSDLNSYVYERTSQQKHGQKQARTEQKPRCLVKFDPESTLLEALEAVRLDDTSDDVSTEEAANHLVVLHQDAYHHGVADSQYAVSFAVTRESNGSDGNTSGRTAVLEFNTAIYSDFQAHNMARAFSQALLGMTGSTVDAVSMRLLEVDMFSQQDQAIINGWNMDGPLALQECIPDLVERTCARFPDQMAVVSSSGEFSLTYSRLNKLAERLGFYLVKKYGLGRGLIVPLCLDKSTLAVVAMLAILKTGAAYCCLDSQHPRARHDFIIKSINASFVLASPRYESLFTWPVLVVDSTLVRQFEEEHQDDNTKFGEKRPGDTCVVLFSSGSTGVPKGIVHTHQTLATGLVQNGPRHGLDHPGIRVFQWCAYTFDISLTEIWGPLICGGVVCVPSEEERLNDVETPMNRMGVEWAFSTPSFARFFCRQNFCVETLKTLVVGGEALNEQDARAFLEGMNLERVVHLFGPAELITQFLKTMTPLSFNTHSSAKKAQAENVPFVPSNAHCWIVDPDDSDRLAPVGAVGELLIEGPALLTGYLNDTARNEVAFVKTPRWRESMDIGPPVYRIYRSGDLVRYAGQGEIRYVTRKDGVVKLRGQFVDLGEIESVLRASLNLEDSIKAGHFETEAAVLLVKDVPAPGDQALVTFLCPKDAKMLSQDRMVAISTVAPVLQTHLRKKLPEYMLPWLFYAVEKFPYNASGKLDRKTLALSASALTMHDLFQLPGLSTVADNSILIKRVDHSVEVHDRQASHEISMLLKKAWVDVLGLLPDDLSSEDDFFQQGGNSMRAMELVAAARRNGVSISVAKIFGNPIFEHLVAAASFCVNRNESAKEVTDLPPFYLLGPPEKRENILKQSMEQCHDIEMSEVLDVLPATPLQAEFMAEGLAYPGSFKAQTWFTVPAKVPLERFQAVWKQLMDSFATMRCRVIHTTKYGDFLVLLDTKRLLDWIKIETSGNTSSNEDLIKQYWERDRSTPMGYGEALVRFAIIGDAEDRDRTVLLTMHQCIYDGFTIKRIEHAMNDLLNGQVSATTNIPSFAPFIKHISTRLDEKAARSFWQNYLAGFGANDKENKRFPALPHPAYASRADSLFATNVQFPAMASTACRGTHITLPTIVLAAWALVINHYTDDRDLVFPLHISGRGVPVPGVMEMPFPTIASVPLRIQLPSDLIRLSKLTTEAAGASSAPSIGIQNFLQKLQEDQIKLASTGFGHAGFATITTYSESCRRAVAICEQYPLGNLDIQYATATWRPKAPDEQAIANFGEPEKQINLEFQVDRNDAKYFSPGDALSLGCYILGDQLARLVVVYDSNVVREEQVAEYTTRIGDLISALITSLG